MSTTNNIFIGANIVFAKADVSFIAAGITSLNTNIIYRVEGVSVSYKPGRTLNAITSFENSKRYYIIAIADMDLSAYLMPPITNEMTAKYFYDVQGNEGSSVTFDGTNSILDLRGKTILMLSLDNEELKPAALDAVTSTDKYNLNPTTGLATFGVTLQPPSQLSILYK